MCLKVSHRQVVSIILVLATQLGAVLLQGTVTDHVGRPVPEALVSLGHSTYRTFSDKTGHFVLDFPETGIRTSPELFKRTQGSIRWYSKRGILDVSDAPGVTSCAVFTLSGARCFEHSVATSGTIAPLPVLAPGVYCVMFTFNNRERLYWRMLSANRSQTAVIPVSWGSSASPSAAVQGETVRHLIFRHDNFFPVDKDISSTSDSVVVRMFPDPRAAVFTDTVVRTYRFTLTHEDSLSMERNALDENYVAAEFSVDGKPFGKVGFRYKGSDYYAMPHCFDSVGTRSNLPECENVSLKIKFNEFSDTARFYDMKKLNLHSMMYDDSKLREMLAYKTFRDMGIYTCRTAYVKVYVNDVYRGLFTAVEQIDGRFTKAHWPEDGDGNLYKEVWPWRTLRSYYTDMTALQTNNSPGDTTPPTRMVNFCRAINGSTAETFRDSMYKFIDIDYWLNYIVVDRAIHNYDGIMTWYVGPGWFNNHNFFWYEEENAGGKAWLIPWDLNLTFDPTDPFVDDYDVPDWNVAPATRDTFTVWGGSHMVPAHFDKFTGKTADYLWPEFKKAGEHFLATVFTPDRMKAQVDKLAALIAPIMKSDPTVSEEKWNDRVGAMRSNFDILHQGFDDHINNRSIAIDSSEFFTGTSADSGLQTGHVNNFEFVSDSGLSTWAKGDAIEGSKVTLQWDTTSPLFGKGGITASLLFTPHDTTESYSEWAYIYFGFDQNRSLAEIDTLRLFMQGDDIRDCWIFIESDAYPSDSSTTNNRFQRYGWSTAITKNRKQFSFAMKNIGYPYWYDGPRPDLLDSVLIAAKGITIIPYARYNEKGQLREERDSGFVKIDNILFK